MIQLNSLDSQREHSQSVKCKRYSENLEIPISFNSSLNARQTGYTRMMLMLVRFKQSIGSFQLITYFRKPRKVAERSRENIFQFSKRESD